MQYKQWNYQEEQSDAVQFYYYMNDASASGCP